MNSSIGRAPVELRSGDRLDREEFHRRYEQTAEDFRAELIGGVVHVTTSRCPISQGKTRALLLAGLAQYESMTPGAEGCGRTTILLGADSELEPDLHLRIATECGGTTRISEDDYLVGPPELIVEVVLDNDAIELHDKKNDYARYGVHEYLVVCVSNRQFRWFDFARNRELQPDTNGIYRSGSFPGLWIDGPALLAQDYAKLMQTLEAGLATPEHAAFVQQLSERRKQTIK